MSSNINTCVQCKSERVMSAYNPPLAEFSKPVDRVTDGDISFDLRWAPKSQTGASTSNVVQMLRISSTTLSTEEIENLSQILKTIPKELIRIILQYQISSTANITSQLRPVCACSNSTQVSEFGRAHALLKKVFPKDPAVDQLVAVPTSTVLVPRPESNRELHTHALQLSFPQSTSFSFRVFYNKTAYGITTDGFNDPLEEAKAGRIEFHAQAPEAPNYTTALIAAVETSSQKITAVAGYHFVDHVMSLEKRDSFPEYRSGILAGLPIAINYNIRSK